MAATAGKATPEAPVNLKQAAGRLDVLYMTAYCYVRQGRLQATRVGTEWQIPLAAIAKFLAGGSGRQPTDGEQGSVDWAGRMTQALLAGDEPSARRVVEAARRQASAGVLLQRDARR